MSWRTTPVVVRHPSPRTANGGSARGTLLSSLTRFGRCRDSPAVSAEPLEAIKDQLREVYTEEGVTIWLNGRNRSLGGRRPIDLLRDGNSEAVRHAVERLASGAM